MKNLVIVISIVFTTTLFLNGQQIQDSKGNGINNLTEKINSDKTYNGKRGQSIYLELGGAGAIYSLNYDLRFNKSLRGLGMRVGVGYTNYSELELLAVPVAINYILGKKNKSNKNIEIGGGATYFIGKERILYDAEKTHNVVGHASFMYRHIDPQGGFSLRAGWTPQFTADYFNPLGFGVSLGYSF